MCNQEELLQKMVGHRKANTKIKKVITSTGTIVLLFRDSEKARFEFLRTWVCFLSGFQKRKLWGTRAQPKFVLSYVHDAFFFHFTIAEFKQNITVSGKVKKSLHLGIFVLLG